MLMRSPLKPRSIGEQPSYNLTATSSPKNSMAPSPRSPQTPTRKAIGLTISAFVTGTGGGLLLYPLIPAPALVGVAVIGIGLVLMLGVAIAAYPQRR